MAECPGIWRLALTKDGGLARLRLPGGRMTADQMDAVATLARDRGNGLIDLTHRANLQIRGLDPNSGPAVAAFLSGHGLMAAEARADRLRNILAPPLTGSDPRALADVGPVVAALDEALQGTPALFALSPKFSFVLDDGGDHGISSLAHDIGLIAEPGARGPVLRISLAGAASGYVVDPARGADAAVALAAVAVNSTEDMPARMAPLLASRSTKEIVERAATGDEALFTATPSAARGAAALKPRIGAHPSHERGRHAFGLGVPLARLSATSAAALAGLARQFGDGSLRLAPWQGVFLTGVGTPDLPALRSAARAAGFLTDARDLEVRILACAGATGCARAGAQTKADAGRLMDALDGTGANGAGPLTIHLSGCERGCAHPGEADILFLGQGEHDAYRAYRHARAGDAGESAQIGAGLTGPELADFVMRSLKGTG